MTAPLVLPGRVLGRDGGVAPSNRVAVGFIGTGRQAIHANLPGFLREPDAHVVAVCDVDQWRVRRAKALVDGHYAKATAAGTYRGCEIVQDWRDLVGRADLDAVMISTPDHWHALMAAAALKAGKDVACEKPLTRNIAEGRWLSDLVRRTGRIFRTDSEFRSLQSMHRAAQLVRNGRIGRVERVITATPKDMTLGPQPAMPVPEGLDYDQWLGPAPAAPYTEQRVHPRQDDRGRPGWICIRDYADGMLANWGAHLNDIALWGCDLEQTGPVVVETTGRFAPAGQLWNVVQEFDARFTFANGVTLRCHTDVPYVRFEGTEGWVEVRYPTEITVSDEALLSWRPGPGDFQFPLKTSEKRDFLDAVNRRQAPLYGVEAGHRVSSLSHLALAALELGRPLRWDPVAERAIGDETADRLLAPKPLRAPWKLEA